MTKTKTMTFEAALQRVTDAVDAGRLCWRCGLAHGDLHPVAGSGRVQHEVADPTCARTRATLIAVRNQLAEVTR